jgi:malate dehydrogenase (oxaloacetate-decarboxylating)
MNMASFQFLKDAKNGKKILQTSLKGQLLLKTSILNKGMAFSQKERNELGLNGLLPPDIEEMEIQLKRIYKAYQEKTSDIERHIFLRRWQDLNETLFYGLLVKHITEMLPIVYTPVVGLACQRFHQIYRQPRGLFIAYPNRDKIEEMLANVDLPDVKVIVVSDGERILGLGDQGTGGMGIPIGKISLYTACGGIFPGYALPIFLDTGTDNEERLEDPLYLGWRHHRVRGKEYEDFVDLFVQAVKKRFPNVLLQWEDFAKDHARLLLNRYQDQLCTFNDDIQGTAAVTVAGILSAVKVVGSTITQQNIVMYGAGSAGTGIADLIVLSMMRQGLSKEEACRRIWLIDQVGLLHEGIKDLAPSQIPYAQPVDRISQMKFNPSNSIGLEEVIQKVHPTILIGVSGCFGAFTENCVKTMAQFTPRPIIFPLSNPTSHCEAHPKDIIEWTEGKALIATGTQFSDVVYKGTTFQIGQCNNSFIFPAMGLGILASKANRVTSNMFLAAAEALSGLSPALKAKGASLFPLADQIRDVALHLAAAVGLQAQKDNVAPKTTPEELQVSIDENFWTPEYVSVQKI